MNKNNNANDPLTVGVLDQRLKDQTSEFNKRFELQDSKINKNNRQLKEELIEAFRSYRDDVLTRMDKDAGELEQIREDQVFITHDIKDHEKRITKLEHSSSAE